MTAQSESGVYSRLSAPDLVAFAMPNLCIGGLAVGLGVYLAPYYAGHYGMSLATVGLAFMAVRLIDTFFDPFIGVAMDKTRSRFGRYRPWLAAGAPVLMVAVYMLFNAPSGVSLAYLIGWLFVYYIGTSLITLSHSAWASAIAANYNERSRVFGVIQLIGVIGATATILLPIVMARRDGHSGHGDVGAMGLFIVGAAGVGVLLALLRTPERPNTRAPETVRLSDYWEMVSRPDMRRIIVADFCLALGPGWMAALYIFYFHEARGFTVANASLLLLIYIMAGILGAPILSRMAMRLGKHRTLMIAATGYSLGLAAMTLLPRGNLPLVGFFMFIMGFLASSFPLLDRAMVADVGDAVRLEQGQHRVGLLYAMITTSQKVASALAIGLSYTVLGWVGFNAKEGSINTPAAIHGLQMVYLIGPISFVMLGGLCFIGYRLDARRHAEIREALAERDAAVSEVPIIEGLTGQGGRVSSLVEPAR
jgi:Na+/melibiose symporter-like transporter